MTTRFRSTPARGDSPIILSEAGCSAYPKSLTAVRLDRSGDDRATFIPTERDRLISRVQTMVNSRACRRVDLAKSSYISSREGIIYCSRLHDEKSDEIRFVHAETGILALNGFIRPCGKAEPAARRRHRKGIPVSRSGS